MLGARRTRARVARRAGHPLAALTAAVHHEVRVPGGRIERVIDRERATAAVADVGDEAGQRADGRARAQEPAADRIAAEAAERHVVDRERTVGLRAVRLEACRRRGRARLVQRASPERIQPRRLRGPAAVHLQFVEREVVERHQRATLTVTARACTRPARCPRRARARTRCLPPARQC